jgi:DNA-directed RNA polymerase alpha subunit
VCEEARKPKDNFLASVGAPARRALEGANIKTLTDLSRWTEPQLLALHGLGPSSIPRLKKVLEANGLSLKE